MIETWSSVDPPEQPIGIHGDIDGSEHPEHELGTAPLVSVGMNLVNIHHPTKIIKRKISANGGGWYCDKHSGQE